MYILFKIAIACVLFPLMSSKVKEQSKTDSLAIQEIVVFTTRGINASGARYHLDKCRYLKNGQIHIDERVALQRGLLPCSVCLPERTSDLPKLREKKEIPKRMPANAATKRIVEPNANVQHQMTADTANCIYPEERKGILKSLQITLKACIFLAIRTRLELATPSVTGLYSNQLNYGP